ncbi:hypothetical protein SEA_KOZIE_84 [Microbacterium phage Kozie]|uniref:Uncharacterized protein n=1 Tax=Microbacterium phage Kozie TaxID=2885981 RepID=A0AAE8Y7U6_9CAUD|nr:hypothetical protein QC998_gp84 [Microbacterium phage Kozie]UDL16280.1 hypothetical protein SEA_KOZIE_84 [Microbacterium phage Kozie]
MSDEPNNVIVLAERGKPRPRRDPIQGATPPTPPAANPGTGTAHPKRQCKATTRAGKRCANPPIDGGAVCRMHGGAAPQVKKRAALRLLELIDPAITTLAREMTTATKSADRQRAANSILDRAGVVRRESPAKEDVYDLVADRLRALREGQG